MPIAVVGTVFLDIKGFPLGRYIPNGRNAGTVEYFSGGVARNIAEDLGNIQMEPVFVSVVDNDDRGQKILSDLQKHGVDTRYVRMVPNGMGVWLAVFDELGDVAGSISQRPKMEEIQRIIVENGEEILSECDSMIIEMDMDPIIVKTALAKAKKLNKPVYGVVANMAIASQRRDLIKRLDGFICNGPEAEMLFLEPISGNSLEENSENLLERVQSSGIKAMIVTLGEQGAIFADCDGHRGVCPAVRAIVKDTTGAGDAFCSGAVAALTHGTTLDEAAKIGSKLAASVIASLENTCPQFNPKELGFDVKTNG